MPLPSGVLPSAILFSPQACGERHDLAEVAFADHLRALAITDQQIQTAPGETLVLDIGDAPDNCIEVEKTRRGSGAQGCK